MGVYYALFAFLIIAGLGQYLFFRDNKLVKILYLAILGVAMVYLVGSRYGIGFDYFVYIDLQKALPAMSWSEMFAYPMEPGFMIFAKLVSMVSTDPHMIYYATAVVVVAIAFYLYYRYSLIPFLSILFFMSLNFYFNTMNSIRYALALVIVMFAYRFIINTKFDYTKENMKWEILKKDLLTNFLPYLAITLVAASFHKSALIMIPLYFMVKIPLTWQVGVVYGVGTLLFCIFGQKVTFLLSDLFFNGNYSTESIYTTPGGSFHMIAPLVICICVGSAAPRILKRYKGSLALLNMAIFSLILFVISAFSVFIFTRIAYYTYVFMTFLIPMAVEAFRISDTEKAEMEALDEKLKDQDLPRSEYREYYKKKKKMQESMKDDKAFYWFGLALSLGIGLFFEYSNYMNGSHDVYPYMSMSNQVNMFTNFIDENDREARALYMREQLNIGRFLKAAQDPNYVIIMAGQGDLFTYDPDHPENGPAYTYSYLEPLEYFGIDTRLAGQSGQSYVAIGEAGNMYYNELSDELIKVSYEVDGRTIEVISSSSSKGSYSSIKIDGEEYCNEWNGLNIVIYDKVTGEVVDSVTCDLTQQTLKETTSPQDYRGYLLWRNARFALKGYDYDTIAYKYQQAQSAQSAQ